MGVYLFSFCGVAQNANSKSSVRVRWMDYHNMTSLIEVHRQGTSVTSHHAKHRLEY